MKTEMNGTPVLSYEPIDPNRINRLEDLTTNLAQSFSAHAVALQSIKSEVAASTVHLSEKLDLIKDHIEDKISGISETVKKMESDSDKHTEKIAKLERQDKKKEKWQDWVRKILYAGVLGGGGILTHIILDYFKAQGK